jgi:hypothetical protein
MLLLSGIKNGTVIILRFCNEPGRIRLLKALRHLRFKKDFVEPFPIFTIITAVLPGNIPLMGCIGSGFLTKIKSASILEALIGIP